uniref:Neurotransmitter-gated ion-channel ligand-binding domain-containing protein n=1 Tax=Pyrodinium bahamense TaxID=73915 RepID=A0A7S0FVM7_9DINO
MTGSPEVIHMRMGGGHLDDAEVADDLAGVQQYLSSPPPPETLWDTDDLQYLDKVSCFVWLRLTSLDPKNGAFEGRMKVEWALRTLNSKERTEPRIRVPGIRNPLLLTTIEESRVWRVDELGSNKTHFWQGISIMTVSGYELFEVQDFPFDRQLVHLDLFDFVWKPEKDSADYDLAMKVVSFKVRTTSMLPDWDTFPAVITPLNSMQEGTGPSNTSRFTVTLRLQRKHKYFIVQVFLTTYLITSAFLLPIILPPSSVSDRLSLHGAGLLTLVAFKYGVSEKLPTVPYTTFTDRYLTLQVIMLVTLALEAVVSFKLTDWGAISEDVMKIFELVLLFVVLIAWTSVFVFSAFFMKRTSWQAVLKDQTTEEMGELRGLEDGSAP